MATSFDARLRDSVRLPLAIHTAGCLRRPDLLKTAIGLLRFAPDRVRAVVDERFGGTTLDRVPGWGAFPAVPIVDDLDDLDEEVQALAVGLALPGATPLIDRHRALLHDAADRGLVVLNGLHDRVGHPGALDLRHSGPDDHVLADGITFRSRRIVTVGTGPNIGKMTTSVALRRELACRGLAADLLATGQTAMMLRGHGRAVDALPSDFAAGVVERLLAELEAQAETVVVEGQGSIHTARYSAVTVAILHGSRPQHHVLCHRVDDPERCPATIADSVRRHARLFDALDISSRLIGVSLDTRVLDDGAGRRLVAEIQNAQGVTAVDPVRNGAGALADAFEATAR